VRGTIILHITQQKKINIFSYLGCCISYHYCQNIKISPDNRNYEQNFKTFSSPKTLYTENM